MSAIRAMVIPLVVFSIVGCKKKPPELPPFQPKPGSLEFCIVANDYDDVDAATRAMSYFESAATNPGKQAELKQLAEAGKPPPPPIFEDGKPFTRNGEKLTYRWLELDPNAIKEYELDKPESKHHEAISTARKQGQLAAIQMNTGIASTLIWSRPRSVAGKNGKVGEIEYFVLIRNALEGNELTEANLEEFDAGEDPFSHTPCVLGRFNVEGGKRLHELTQENKPSDDPQVTRQMAIIVEGRVFKMPNLQSAIGERFQISGDFTKEYVKEVVTRVRTAGH